MGLRSVMVAVALLGCGQEGNIGSGKTDGEVCGNQIDDDGNGLVDCADPVCLSAECPEACGDGIDNNLDGRIDCEDFGCDGHCPEVCDDDRDNDGDGGIDCFDAECADRCDVDRDGAFNPEVGGDDCDDADADVFPGAPEVCDGADNDCDGLVDDADPTLDPQSRIRWFPDNDGDGYGFANQAPILACAGPPGRVDNEDDCYDLDGAVFPGALEVCNGFDDDCDGLVDDADPTVDLTTGEIWYADADGDGLGDPAVFVQSCGAQPGLVDNDEDCDDTSDVILGPSQWVLDADGDGFGNGVGTGPVSCVPPGPNYGPDNAQDCDDTDATVFPGAYEVCGDLVDSDCDGSDCSEWGDDFESGALTDWTTGGAAPWFTQGTTVNMGSLAAECGNINDNEESTLSVTLDFATAGTVSFAHTGSTESTYDHLRFYVDGTQELEVSGSWAWTSETFNVTAGTHTLTWAYEKDFSVSTGADTVWIDDVETTGALP